MTHAALPFDEKTDTGRCRDLSREHRNAERARAARRMLRERRQRQSASSVEPTGYMTAETDPRNAQA